MRRLILAVALIMLAVAPATAQAPVATWDHLGEAVRPARLSDCPPGTRATVSFNSGAYALWSRFCYWGTQ